MAIMVQVSKKGTNLKTNIVDGIKRATLKLRICLIFSILFNIFLTYFIFRLTGK